MSLGTALAPHLSVLAIAAAAMVAAPGAGAANSLPDPRLGALFAVEKSALGAVAPGHVERILDDAEAPIAHDLAERDLTCLTRALYHEARGEGEAGMLAVAEVVLNRTESAAFPDTVCAVVEQGAGNGRGCQFSFVCDGSERRRLERAAWARAQDLAQRMAEGAPRQLTDGATHFHTTAVNPPWSRVYELTAEIGAHRFYRRPLEIASN
ncbi:MAG: cell wall hydrolase [Alkalilacustris sp.]